MAILYTQAQIDLSKNEALMAQREALMETSGITLNGRPAAIRGRLLKFPSVYNTEGEQLEAQYSWDAIKNVIEKSGGAFKS